MTVYSFDPAHRNEIVKRRLELGDQVPQGIKLVGEWSYLGSGKVFRLIETASDDGERMLQAIQPWTDLGTLEIYPVLETEKVLEAYTRGKSFARA
jgi:hypothetical protein